MDFKVWPCAKCGFRGGEWCWPADADVITLDQCPLRDVREAVERLEISINKAKDAIEKRQLQDTVLAKNRTIIRLTEEIKCPTTWKNSPT